MRRDIWTWILDIIIFPAPYCNYAWIRNFIIDCYSITEKSFLSAKHEMIDRDLNNISSYVPGLMQTDWFWHYAKEHSDDLVRDLTDEEKALYESREIQEALYPYWNLERHDFENCDPALQLFLARDYCKILALKSGMFHWSKPGSKAGNARKQITPPSGAVHAGLQERFLLDIC